MAVSAARARPDDGREYPVVAVSQRAPGAARGAGPARLLVRLQNGYARSYAGYMIAGVVVALIVALGTRL